MSHDHSGKPRLAGVGASGATSSFDSFIREAARTRTSPCAANVSVGSALVAGRFHVTRRIGRGGMGTVWEAFDRDRRVAVALKTILQPDAVGIYCLKNEFRSLAEVRHENLVSLHELFFDADRWFFTMDLVEGTPFAAWVRPGGRLDELRLRDALAQLVLAVKAIHRAGKLHRDLKPSNVLVTRAGRLVVLDFGLAADPEAGGRGQTRPSALLAGTPEYMSPEQAAGRCASTASDFYSLGVMLFEALMGRLPFAGTPGEILAAKQRDEAPLVDAAAAACDLRDLTRKLLTRDPASRPTASALVAALRRDASEASPPSSRAGRAPARALLGRERELGALRRAYDSTLRGRANLFVVHGERGIGKTWLCHRFLDNLRAEGWAVVLAGRCYESERVPFRALDSLIDDLTRYLRKLPREQSAALMPRDVFALATLFPVLGRVGVVEDAPVRHGLGASELRAHAFAAFAELLGRIRDRRPLVVHLDDLERLDADSAALLRHLFAGRRRVPGLFLVSHRDESSRPNLRLTQVLGVAQANRDIAFSALWVPPLADEHVEALAREWVAGAGLEPNVVGAIARESHGSPFLALELSRFARSQRETSRDALSLSSVIAARTEGLSRAARHLLEALALVGRPMRVEVMLELARATHLDLEELRTARFTCRFESGGQQFVDFYHDRVRAHVCHALTRTMRDGFKPW